MMISVRSNNENYIKESSGIKSNTVRFLDDNDTIIVVNTDTGDTFTRIISDITTYKGAIIISWRN